MTDIMTDEIFKMAVADFDKLKDYGFWEEDGKYKYSLPFLENQFTLFISVDENSFVSTKLIDNATGEEYILHIVGGQGNFVGKVREELFKELKKIRQECFFSQVYKFPQTIEVIKGVEEIFSDKPEYLWKNFPTDAIWRRRDNKKWYGLIMSVRKNKIIPESEGTVEVLVIRVNPDSLEQIVDEKHFFKGYHMNKKHWITIILDYSVGTEQIMMLLKDSYNLAK